jgi:hypothetical protein
MRCTTCKANLPADAQFCTVCGAIVPQAVVIETVPLNPKRERFPPWILPTVGTFAVGLALVLLTRRIWPGLPVVLFLSAVVGSLTARSVRALLATGIWLLAALIVWRIPSLWLPALFVVVGLSAAVALLRQR